MQRKSATGETVETLKSTRPSQVSDQPLSLSPSIASSSFSGEQGRQNAVFSFYTKWETEVHIVSYRQILRARSVYFIRDTFIGDSVEIGEKLGDRIMLPWEKQGGKAL